MNKIKVIRKEGGSKILAVTDIIPADWEIVTTDVIKSTDKIVTVKIEKIR